MSPSRRGLLRLGSVALAGSLTGCASGALKVRESGDSNSTADTADSTTASDPTTHALGVETSLPDSSGSEASVEFPDGPKSRPERPADVTAANVREYAKTFERRWVYNRLYRGKSTEIRQECGVDSVVKYGEGFRVVVWCSAWATTDRNGTTIHADYFTQYATYFVGPNSTVRRDGKSRKR